MKSKPNFKHGLIKSGQKIFAIHQDRNNFLVTITETAQNGARIKRVYKQWEDVPEQDRVEYSAACALRDVNNTRNNIFNKNNEYIKK